MNKKLNKQFIELLAPAKDLDNGILAVNCGADAVYIGGPKYGARANAGNTLKEIERLIKYAHFYRSKVYVALNTLLHDSELDDAQLMIQQLHGIGTDALIIQDMGILEMDLPSIALFASTQTHNSTPEKVLFLEKAGFQRVILARELTYNQIKSIREKTTVELESFIHGALCVSYSGQCYLSYALGKRSGNRGECAQPCRNLYSLFTESGKKIIENKHLLSLKDLSLSGYLDKMIDYGITSFKIEGRLKDSSYIKNVVTYYRKEIDGILDKKNLEKSSRGTVFTNLTPNLSKTYNRDYCDYFINGRKKGISSWDTPKWRGECIGIIKELSQNGVVIKLKSPDIQLNPADGLCYFNSEGILTGTLINEVSGDVTVLENTKGLKVDAFIYRNHDQGYLKNLKASKVARKIRVDLEFVELSNGFYLKAEDEEGLSVVFEREMQKEAAKDPEQALNNLEKQLRKTGETPFFVDQLKIKFEKEPVFIPISQINEMRREVLELLVWKRDESYKIVQYELKLNEAPYPEKHLDYSGNVLNQLAKKFYQRHGVTEIEMAAESGLDLKNKKAMTVKYCILNELDLCLKLKPSTDQYYLKDTKGQKYSIKFDCENCCMELYFNE